MSTTVLLIWNLIDMELFVQNAKSYVHDLVKKNNLNIPPKSSWAYESPQS